MKRFRVYFNVAKEFPHIWSVDEGSHASEVVVQQIVMAPGVTPLFCSNMEATSTRSQKHGWK